MTAFITLDTSVLDAQIEGLIEAINATTTAVQQVLAAVESLSARIDALEGDHPDEPSLPPLVDENGDALTDELDQVLTEGAADG